MKKKKPNSPTVELLRMFLPHHVETVCDGGVLTENERLTGLFCEQPTGCKQHKFDTDAR